jgi:hypothetical protein
MACGLLGGYLATFFLAARWMEDLWHISPWISLPVGSVAGGYLADRSARRVHSLRAMRLDFQRHSRPDSPPAVARLINHFVPHLAGQTPDDREGALAARVAHASRMLEGAGETWLAEGFRSGPAIVVHEGKSKKISRRDGDNKLVILGWQELEIGASASGNSWFVFQPSTVVYLTSNNQLVQLNVNSPLDRSSFSLPNEFIDALQAPQSVTHSFYRDDHRFLFCVATQPQCTLFLVDLDAADVAASLVQVQLPTGPTAVQGCISGELEGEMLLMAWAASKSGKISQLHLWLWRPQGGELRSTTVIHGEELLCCTSWKGEEAVFIAGGRSQSVSLRKLWEVGAENYVLPAELSASGFDADHFQHFPADPAEKKGGSLVLPFNPDFGEKTVAAAASLALPNEKMVLAVAREGLGVTVYECSQGRPLYSLMHLPEPTLGWLAQLGTIFDPELVFKATQLKWVTDARGYPSLMIAAQMRRLSNAQQQDYLMQHTWSEGFAPLQTYSGAGGQSG